MKTYDSRTIQRIVNRLQPWAGLALWLWASPAATADEPHAAARLELPGLTADRDTKTVRLQAETTAVRAEEPMEFFLIHRRSGHDYEAFSVTDVLPSDIHRALEFIGLESGRHVDPERLRFWPEGPRVSIRIEQPMDPNDAESERLVYHAEDTVLDMRTGESLPRTGFTFAGSVRLHDDAPVDSAGGYAADELEPHAVVTFFNLPTTVLDIPRRAPQGAVYDIQVRHPQYTPPERTPITIVLEPIPPPHPDGLRLDVRLAVSPGPDRIPVFELETATETVLRDGTDEEVAAWINKRIEEGREVWCAPAWDEGLALPALQAAAELLTRLALDTEVRIKPPPSGEIYYQSFLPDPSFRDREHRPAQPWELHLRREDPEWAGLMIRHERDYSASLEQGGRVFKGTVEADAPDPETFRDVLDHDPSGLSVILVFAPAESTLEELRAWIRPALPTHPIVYVFPDTP